MNFTFISFDKKNSSPRLAVGLFFSSAVFSLMSSPAGAVTWEGAPAGYGIVWSDEFNGALGSQPNPSNWGYDLGDGGYGTGEIEYDTDDAANAHIVADPNATPGNTTYNTPGRYTSARIHTESLQAYGQPTNTYYVARIHLAHGYGGGTADGIGEAWWMLGSNFPTVGWPSCGEVDILENGFSNTDGANMHSTLHYQCSGYDGQSGNYMGLLGGQNLGDDYHTFAALILNNQVQFFLDGNLFNTITPANTPGCTWAFNVSDFMILSMGTGGGDPVPDASSSFPATMMVDYARVYQQGLPTPVPVTSYTWNVACGDDTYVDGNGVTWAADTNFTGGWPAYTSNAISNQTNQNQLYQYGRVGNTTGGAAITYTFNVPPDSYQVKLGFAEDYWTGAGQRLFNVTINGVTELNNFDIWSDAGGIDKADVKTFNNITPNASGQIVIQLNPGSVSYPLISSIQILPVTGLQSPTVTSTSTPIPTNTSTPVEQCTWRIAAGDPVPGAPVTDGSSLVWSPDSGAYVNGGIPVTFAGAIVTNEFANGRLALFQTQWEADPFTTGFTYSFNVPAGTSQVSLFFAEPTGGPATVTAAGQRVFNIGINGSTVTSNFDIYAAAGNKNNVGVTQVYANVSPNASGQIAISFTKSGGTFPPMVAALQLICNPPSVTYTPTNTSTNTPLSTVTNTATNTQAPATNTFTATPTLTFTLTLTNSPTDTVTVTPTHTVSPTITNTPAGPTSTLTNTPSQTIAATATHTIAMTNTYSPTITHTPNGPTATLTLTGTNSFTPTGTATFTVTHTITTTLTSTSTITYTPHGPTATLTNTFSPTNTYTFTSSPTFTDTLTVTSTATLTASFSPTDTSTPTMTWTGTPTQGNTATITNTPTQTSTPTLTFTPTPTVLNNVLYTQPFPNPATQGTVEIDVTTLGAASIEMDVFTTGFRKIAERSFNPPAGNPLGTVTAVQWDLRDRFGMSVANGLYYVRVQVKGRYDASRIFKVLVLR